MVYWLYKKMLEENDIDVLCMQETEIKLKGFTSYLLHICLQVHPLHAPNPTPTVPTQGAIPEEGGKEKNTF